MELYSIHITDEDLTIHATSQTSGVCKCCSFVVLLTASFEYQHGGYLAFEHKNSKLQSAQIYFSAHHQPTEQRLVVAFAALTNDSKCLIPHISQPATHVLSQHCK